MTEKFKIVISCPDYSELDSYLMDLLQYLSKTVVFIGSIQKNVQHITSRFGGCESQNKCCVNQKFRIKTKAEKKPKNFSKPKKSISVHNGRITSDQCKTDKFT